MKKFFLFLLFLIFLIGIINAQEEEEAKYNFGSAQAVKELRISPGEEITTKLYFYNIHGNRITHISLEVAEAPGNWGIIIDPPIHETTVSVSGVPTTIEENLFVEPPSDVTDIIPNNVPEGIEYVSSPVGYVGAKPVKIKIKIPADEKIGKVVDVRIDAVASWLGQTGTAALTQGRSFDYKITVVSKEFTETILEEAPEKKEEVAVVEEEKISVLEPTSQVVEKEVQVGVPTSTFVSVVVILLVIIVGMIIFFVMKKKKFLP